MFAGLFMARSLLSLDVSLEDGTEAKLSVCEGDDPSALARAFVSAHHLPLGAVLELDRLIRHSLMQTVPVDVKGKANTAKASSTRAVTSEPSGTKRGYASQRQRAVEKSKTINQKGMSIPAKAAVRPLQAPIRPQTASRDSAGSDSLVNHSGSVESWESVIRAGPSEESVPVVDISVRPLLSTVASKSSYDMCVCYYC